MDLPRLCRHRRKPENGQEGVHEWEINAGSFPRNSGARRCLWWTWRGGRSCVADTYPGMKIRNRGHGDHELALGSDSAVVGHWHGLSGVVDPAKIHLRHGETGTVGRHRHHMTPGIEDHGVPIALPQACVVVLAILCRR